MSHKRKNKTTKSAASAPWNAAHFSRTTLIVLVLAIGLVFALHVMAALRLKVFTSDDVAYQTMIQAYHHLGGHKTSYLGSDSFILKDWLYVLHPFQNGTRAMLAFSGIAGATSGLVLATFIYMRFARESFRRDKLSAYLSLGWLATTSYYFIIALINPNTRNIDLGLDLACMYLFQRIAIEQSDIERATRPRWQLPALYVAASLLAFSDPYFLYFFLVPFGLWTVLRAWRAADRSRQILQAFGLVIASFVGSKIMVALLGILSVRVAANYPLGVSKLADVPHRAKLLVTGTMHMFGITHDWPLTGMLLGLACAGIAGVVAYTYITQRRVFGRKFQFLAGFALAQALVLSVAYCVTTVSVDAGTSRYLVLLPFCAVAITLSSLASMQAGARLVLRYLLVAAIVVAGFQSLTVLKLPSHSAKLATLTQNLPFNVAVQSPITNEGNQANIQLAKALAPYRSDVGYAAYWSASINTYFSRQLILPVSCDAITGAITPVRLVSVVPDNVPASSETFLVTTRAGKPDDCNAAAIRLGKPVHTLDTALYHVSFYSYNIGDVIYK